MLKFNPVLTWEVYEGTTHLGTIEQGQHKRIFFPATNTALSKDQQIGIDAFLKGAPSK